MIHLVKQIIHVEPYSLTLRYNTGETVEVDLHDKLVEWTQSPDSKFKMLLDEDYFQSVQLDKEADTVYWDNGIDFCPDVLYDLGKAVEQYDDEKSTISV